MVGWLHIAAAAAPAAEGSEAPAPAPEAGRGTDAALDRAAGLELTALTSVAPRSFAPPIDVPALSGDALVGGESAVRLRFGVSARFTVPLPARSTASASFGVWRDQAFCDVCAGGASPGWLGSELLGSTDLTLRVDHAEPLGDGDGRMLLRAVAVLPASRDALSCNPMYGAPGAGATFVVPARDSAVLVAVDARRPFYAARAAPVGRCAPPLHDPSEIPTLTGAVTPTPWTSWYGVENPMLTGAASVGWSDPHGVIPGAPRGLRTELELGLRFERASADPAARVDTLTGPVVLPAAANPVRTSIPWSLGVGWAVGSAFEAGLSVGNALPTPLADPGGTFRALPATTTWTAAATGRF